VPPLFLFVVLCSCGVKLLFFAGLEEQAHGVSTAALPAPALRCRARSIEQRSLVAPFFFARRSRLLRSLFLTCGYWVVGDRAVQVVASKRTGASRSSLRSAVCRPSARALSCTAASSPTVGSPLFYFCLFLILRQSEAPPLASLFSLCLHCVFVLSVAVRGESGCR
jgi:hypothetical protein